MLPFKRGAFHLAVQAQVITTSSSALEHPDPCHPFLAVIIFPFPQVPIIPIVMSSYQDFYCKKERRFTSGEDSVDRSGGKGYQKGCGSG